MFVGYTAFLGVYGFTATVIYLSGSSAHFHLHHAISAAFLSIFWTDFSSVTDVITNGVLIGKAATISFYA